MKQKIVIANWKMNLLQAEAVLLVKDLIKSIGEAAAQVEVVLCPSFTSLDALNQLTSSTKIKLGGQNMFWEDKGAYTGEISSRMLREWNCQYVIVGHSERRENFGEIDEMVNKKVLAALENNLKPIICVGETKAERQAGRRKTVVQKQLNRVLKNVKLENDQEIIIAYEPVWVIGTGKPVKPDDAEEMHQVIDGLLKKLYSPALREKHFRIIYGGSVDSRSAPGFFAQELIDGFLVGGASLILEEFTGIVRAALNK